MGAYGEISGFGYDRRPGSGSNSGWVEYRTRREADAAVLELDERRIEGWGMRLKAPPQRASEAQPRSGATECLECDPGWTLERPQIDTQKVDPKSTPERPQIDPRTTLNRPRIDPKLTSGRPRIDPRTILDRHQIDTQSTPRSTLDRQIDPRLTLKRTWTNPGSTPSRSQMGAQSPPDRPQVIGCGDLMC